MYFTSDDQSVARVDPRTGKITAVAVGTATITATASTAKYLATGTVNVTVVHPAATLTVQDGYATINATAGTAYDSAEFTVISDGAALNASAFTCTEGTVTVTAGTVANSFIVHTTNATPAGEYTINIVGGADASHSDGNATITVNVAS